METKIALLVVGIYVLIDALYAYYTISVTKGKALKSALSASAIYTLTSLGLIKIVDNHLYIIPMVIGSFIGTYLITWWNKRNGKEIHS